MKPNNCAERVFIVANSLFTVTNFRKELIECLQKKGYEVIVLCPSICNLSLNQNSVEKQLEDLGVSHLPIELSRQGVNVLEDLKLVRQIYNHCRTYKPKFILNYTIKPVIYASIAGKFAGVRIVASNITGLGYVFTDHSFKARLLRSLVKALYRFSLSLNNLVFFQNKDDLSAFDDGGLVKRGRTVLLNGSGVNLELYSPKIGSLVHDPLRLLFVGRLLKDKGVRELIDAAYKLKNSGVTFTLIGGLDDNPNCVDIGIVEQAQKNGVIKYLGPVKDVREFLYENDVFVLPSYREGTPRSTLEAMACGLPIITTDVPGCRETVMDNINGFLIEPFSSQSIVEKVLLLKDKPQLVVEMGKRSREFAEQSFDVNDINRQITHSLGM